MTISTSDKAIALLCAAIAIGGTIFFSQNADAEAVETTVMVGPIPAMEDFVKAPTDAQIEAHIEAHPIEGAVADALVGAPVIKSDRVCEIFVPTQDPDTWQRLKDLGTQANCTVTGWFASEDDAGVTKAVGTPGDVGVVLKTTATQ